MNQDNRTVQVIVSRCVGDRIYGDRLVDQTFSSLTQAKLLGAANKAEGKSVIVRPNYNEEDEKGRFFREWRSFNGESFKEVRWDLVLNKPKNHLNYFLRVELASGEVLSFPVNEDQHRKLIACPQAQHVVLEEVDETGENVYGTYIRHQEEKP
jgi:hypothetical protein